jgi:hypothetical protein
VIDFDPRKINEEKSTQSNGHLSLDWVLLIGGVYIIVLDKKVFF